MLDLSATLKSLSNARAGPGSRLIHNTSIHHCISTRARVVTSIVFPLTTRDFHHQTSAAATASLLCNDFHLQHPITTPNSLHQYYHPGIVSHHLHSPRQQHGGIPPSPRLRLAVFFQRQCCECLQRYRVPYHSITDSV